MQITLNLTPGKIRPPINVVQGDTGDIKELIIYLYEDSAEYTPPSGATVVFQGTKPDGYGFSYDCEFDGNAVTVNFSEQATAVAGNFPVELQITEGTTNRIRSASAMMVVADAALPDGTIISGDDYQALVSYVTDAQTAATAAAASASSATASATAAATSATSAAASATAAAATVEAIVAGNEAYTKAESDNRYASGIWLKPQSNNGMVQDIYPADGSQLEITLRGLTTQDGEGDPSPDNIREITGVGESGGVSALVSGKNMSAISETTGSNYVTISTILNPSETYTVSVAIKSGEVQFNVNSKLNGATVTNAAIFATGADASVRHSRTFTGADELYIYPVYKSSYSPAYSTVKDIQLEVGDTATDYEPYREHYNDSIPLSQPLYSLATDNSGNYTDADGQAWIADLADLTSGEITRNCHSVTFDGTENWGTDASTSAQSYTLSPATEYEFYSINADAMCSHWPTVSYTEADGGSATGYNASDYHRFYVNSIFSTLDAFKAYLAAQYAAGTPVTVVYRLSTPITESIDPITLTATQEDKYNPTSINVTASEGEFDCGYNKDGTFAYTELINAILDAGGTE